MTEAAQYLNGSAAKVLPVLSEKHTERDRERLQGLLDRSSMDVSVDHPAPPPVLTFGGIRSVTQGGLSVCKGASKSRKSTLAALLVSRYLRPDLATEDGDDFIRGTSLDTRKAVVFDTEQARDRLAEVWRPHYKRLGSHAHRLELHSCVGFDANDMLEMIRFRLDSDPGSVGLVLIDVASDLTTHMNDAEEAARVARELMAVFLDHPTTHLMVVNHTNRGNTETAGHYGLILDKKAETVFLVTKDPNRPDLSIVTADKTRREPFESFAIVMRDGLPYVETNVKTTAVGRPRGVAYSDFRFDELAHIISECYYDGDELNVTTLKTRIKAAVEDRQPTGGQTVGEARARSFIEEYAKAGYIENVGTTHRPLYRIDRETVDSLTPELSAKPGQSNHEGPAVDKRGLFPD